MRTLFSKPCFRTEEGTLEECHSTLTVKNENDGSHHIIFHRPFSFSRWTDQFWIVTLITARAVGNKRI